MFKNNQTNLLPIKKDNNRTFPVVVLTGTFKFDKQWNQIGLAKVFI